MVPLQFYAEKVCNPFLVKAGLVRDRLHLPTWAGRADALAIRGTWGSEVRLGISFDLLFVPQRFEDRDFRKSEIFFRLVLKAELSFGRPELPTRAHLSLKAKARTSKRQPRGLTRW